MEGLFPSKGDQQGPQKPVPIINRKR